MLIVIYWGEIELPELRRQDVKNRQNSIIDDLDPAMLIKLEKQMNTLLEFFFSII